MAKFKITFLSQANSLGTTGNISDLGLYQATERGRQIGSLYSPWPTKFARVASAPNPCALATAMIIGGGRPSDMIVKIDGLDLQEGASAETTSWEAAFAIGEFTDGVEDGEHCLIIGNASAMPAILAKFIDAEHAELLRKVSALSFVEAAGITATFESGRIVTFDELPALEAQAAA